MLRVMYLAELCSCGAPHISQMSPQARGNDTDDDDDDDDRAAGAFSNVHIEHDQLPVVQVIG